MAYLYVCEFSNGWIKVGRSINPAFRISQHADRVACVGVDITRSRAFECTGHLYAAESRLIRDCADACESRRSKEWFSGLVFDRVCECAERATGQVSAVLASSDPEGPMLEVQAMVRQLMTNGTTQKQIADALGLAQPSVSDIAQGKTGKRPSYQLMTNLKQLVAQNQAAA